MSFINFIVFIIPSKLIEKYCGNIYIPYVPNLIVEYKINPALQLKPENRILILIYVDISIIKYELR